MSTEPKIHPFEAAGMGVGPYQWVGTYDLGEAMDPNSARNFGNMTGALADAPKLKAGLGTCACCGHGIMIICIVEDAAGDRWGVGSDCVMKTEDRALGDKAKVAVAKRRKAMQAAKREAKRKAERERWLAIPSTDSRALPGETNGMLLERRQREMNAEWEAQEAKRAAWIAKHQKVFAVLTDALQRGNHFAGAMNGALAEGPLTERQAECTAKFLYSRGTPEFDQLVHDLTTR